MSLTSFISPLKLLSICIQLRQRNIKKGKEKVSKAGNGCSPNIKEINVIGSFSSFLFPLCSKDLKTVS